MTYCDDALGNGNAGWLVVAQYRNPGNFANRFETNVLEVCGGDTGNLFKFKSFTFNV